LSWYAIVKSSCTTTINDQWFLARVVGRVVCRWSYLEVSRTEKVKPELVRRGTSATDGEVGHQQLRDEPRTERLQHRQTGKRPTTQHPRQETS
jgi:hypothetical protein